MTRKFIGKYWIDILAITVIPIALIGAGLVTSLSFWFGSDVDDGLFMIGVFLLMMCIAVSAIWVIACIVDTSWKVECDDECDTL